MRQNMRLVLVITAFLIILSAGKGISQEENQGKPQDETIAVTPTEPETQWLWGEIVSLDTQKNEMVVRYPDYETDTEKEITISVNDKTTYENVKSIDEIAPKDTVSIDYVVGTEGKNTAKNISAEKGEKQQPAQEGNITKEEAPIQELVTAAEQEVAE